MFVRIIAAVAALSASAVVAPASASTATVVTPSSAQSSSPRGSGPLGTIVVPATRPAAASKPGAAAAGPTIPADCTTNALHLDHLNKFSLVSSGQARTTNGSLIDALAVRKLEAAITFTPVAVAPVSLTFPTASTVEVILFAAGPQGHLFRLVINSSFGTGTQRWSSKVETARISVGGFATARTMTYKDSLLYVMRSDNTLTRYQARPGLVGLMNTTRLPRYDWNNTYTSISLSNNVVTGTGGSRVLWHQLRGISPRGALMEARVARTSAGATGSYQLGPRGWDIYSYLYTGSCTNNATTMMMMGALKDGRLELWKHTWSDRLTGGLLERKLIFTPNQLGSGRLFG